MFDAKEQKLSSNYLPITEAWEVDLVDLVLWAKETILCGLFALTASLLFSQLKAKATKQHCSFSVWWLPVQSTKVDFFNLRSFPIAISLFLQLTNWKDSLYLKTKCTLFHYRDVIIGHMRRSGYETRDFTRALEWGSERVRRLSCCSYK